MIANSVIVRSLGLQSYMPTWRAMQQFTFTRHVDTVDEIWLVEHPSVFTQGQNGHSKHVLNPGDIPVIQVDRGGQVTHHGPGQLVVYTLINIQRKHLTIRQLINALEKTVIDVLAVYFLSGTTQAQAPGVYINAAKICSLGLRVKRGCTYHGFALNITNDLQPFSCINPCGFEKLAITRLADLLHTPPPRHIIEDHIIQYLTHNLGYNEPLYTDNAHAT